jgi:hypothetical protein
MNLSDEDRDYETAEQHREDPLWPVPRHSLNGKKTTQTAQT